jgi:hypothetical protein
MCFDIGPSAWFLLFICLWLMFSNSLVDVVTMQAQRVAPPDRQCKDKFLIQSTVVPFGTTEEDITSDMVRIMVAI